MRAIQFFELRVLHSFECISHLSRLNILVEDTIVVRLFSLTLIKGNGSESKALLFCAIENMLIQAFLLLSDQFLLECQLVGQGMSISKFLIDKELKSVPLDRLILSL